MGTSRIRRNSHSQAVLYLNRASCKRTGVVLPHQELKNTHTLTGITGITDNMKEKTSAYTIRRAQSGSKTELQRNCIENKILLRVLYQYSVQSVDALQHKKHNNNNNKKE